MFAGSGLHFKSPGPPKMALGERAWRPNGGKMGLQSSQTHKRTNQDPDERSQKPEEGPQEPTRSPNTKMMRFRLSQGWRRGGGGTERNPGDPPPSPLSPAEPPRRTPPESQTQSLSRDSAKTLETLQRLYGKAHTPDRRIYKTVLITITITIAIVGGRGF